MVALPRAEVNDEVSERVVPLEVVVTSLLRVF